MGAHLFGRGISAWKACSRQAAWAGALLTYSCDWSKGREDGEEAGCEAEGCNRPGNSPSASLQQEPH